MRSLAWAVACSLLLSTLAAAESSVCVTPMERQVTVLGTGVVRLVPDRVSFTVGVETEGPSVTQAFRANSSKLNAVLTAFKAKGIQPREIQTSHLEVTSRDDEGKRLAGFRVSNRVTVTREDPSTVADLLQAAISSGANQAGSLRFFVAEPSKAQQRGLELAYQDARSKAERLAALANLTLGEALRITETATWGGGPQNSSLAESVIVAAAPSIEVGSEQVSFGVSVTYELKPR